METARSIILSALVLVGLWSLLPSRTLRILRTDRRTHPRSDRIRSWGRYPALKGLFGIHTLINNIKAMEEFTKQDLEDFNRLLGKLDQPSATVLEFERFSPLPGPQYAAVESPSTETPITKVSSMIRFGVKWEEKVLRKALVRGCSSDFAALTVGASRNEDLANFTAELGTRLGEGIRLMPEDVEDYFDSWGLHARGDDFLTSLAEAHPDGDFQSIMVRAGDRFRQRTMKVNGLTTPGQYCYVTEVTHMGLARKSDPEWSLPAYVKIQNQDPSEQV